MSAVLKIVEPILEPDVVDFPDVHWCQLTKIGLKLIRPNVRVGYEEWENLKPQLTVMEKGVQFAVGDWLVVGEAQHGEKAAQAVDASEKTGIKPGTLMEYRRVSQKVPYPIRMESLEWSHHQIVAYCETKAERVRWLAEAAKNDWKPAELRREIKAAAAPAINDDAEEDQNYLDPHYKTLLLDYIATQYSFLNRCTYEPFKRRIEKSIRGAKYELARTPSGDLKAVEKAVDDGVGTEKGVIEADVFLTEAEIKRIFVKMVGSEPCLRKPGTSYYSEKPPVGNYEWRPIEANTDDARGGRKFGCFNKKEPSGDAYQGARVYTHYESPTAEIDWGLD